MSNSGKEHRHDLKAAMATQKHIAETHPDPVVRRSASSTAQTYKHTLDHPPKKHTPAHG